MKAAKSLPHCVGSTRIEDCDLAKSRLLAADRGRGLERAYLKNQKHPTHNIWAHWHTISAR